jgi:hypothetical protein
VRRLLSSRCTPERWRRRPVEGYCLTRTAAASGYGVVTPCSAQLGTTTRHLPGRGNLTETRQDSAEWRVIRTRKPSRGNSTAAAAPALPPPVVVAATTSATFALGATRTSLSCFSGCGRVARTTSVAVWPATIGPDGTSRRGASPAADAAVATAPATRANPRTDRTFTPRTLRRQGASRNTGPGELLSR